MLDQQGHNDKENKNISKIFQKYTKPSYCQYYKTMYIQKEYIINVFTSGPELLT